MLCQLKRITAMPKEYPPGKKCAVEESQVQAEQGFSCIYSQRWSTTLLLTLNRGTSWGIGTSIEVPGTSHSGEVTFSRLQNNSLSLLYLCKFQWATSYTLAKIGVLLKYAHHKLYSIVNKSIATNHPLPWPMWLQWLLSLCYFHQQGTRSLIFFVKLPFTIAF